MLLYEKGGNLNLDFAPLPQTTPDVSVVKSGVAVSVKLSGVDVLTGTSGTIDIDVTSNAEGVVVASTGITSTVATVALKVTTDTTGITLKYAFGSAEDADVPANGEISKVYADSAEDTLKITAVAENGATYSETIPVTVTLG